MITGKLGVDDFVAAGLSESDLAGMPREALGHGGDAETPRAVAEREAAIIAASRITPESVDWLWPGRLARGIVANCVGLPDQRVLP